MNQFKCLYKDCMGNNGNGECIGGPNGNSPDIIILGNGLMQCRDYTTEKIEE